MATIKEDAARRDFIKAALVGGAAAALGCGNKDSGDVATGSVAPAPTVVTKWKVQCVWDAGTDGYTAFQKFCANVKELSEGRLELEAHSAGQLVGSFDMFDAVKAGTVDAMNCFTTYWGTKLPACAFLTSYPL